MPWRGCAGGNELTFPCVYFSPFLKQLKLHRKDFTLSRINFTLLPTSLAISQSPLLIPFLLILEMLQGLRASVLDPL